MNFYQADWVCPISSPPIRNGVLAVANGRIAAVGTTEIVPSGADRTVYTGCAIIPGLVNAHTHIELTLFEGLVGGLSFFDWITRLVRLKYELCTRDDLRVSAQLGALRMLQAGVTTLGEVMDTGTAWEAMREFGLRGVVYQEVFGPDPATASESLRNLRNKVDSYRPQETATMRIGVSPHAPYTVSRKLYESVRDYARHEGLRMTAHGAESREETRFVRDGGGPFADAHRMRGIEVVPRRCTPIAYLNQMGVLGPDMLLVHAIESDSQDLDMLASSGTFVAHCPRSNEMLGHALADIQGMRARGVTVALGTDSAASNVAMDMFAEMGKVSARESFRFEDALRMATLDGAWRKTN